MTISNVSSSGDINATDAGSRFKQTRADFQSIASALQSGNLDQAQQAFGQLQKDNPRLAQLLNSPASGTDSPRVADLKALASALQNKDLPGAQQAFSALQQTAQAGVGRHHHHNSAATGSASAGGAVDSDGDHDGSTAPGSVFQASA